MNGIEQNMWIKLEFIEIIDILAGKRYVCNREILIEE